MTRNELLAYVETLEPRMQAIYHVADQFVRQAADTLDESFQVAAAVMTVFEERAKSK